MSDVGACAGVPAADAAKKISGVHKRCWKYIPNSYKAEQITSQPQPEPEAQAAWSPMLTCDELFRESTQD